MNDFKVELLETIVKHPSEFVDITFLLHKYCGAETTFTTYDETLSRCRLKLNLVLRDLKASDWIMVAPANGFSVAHGYNQDLDCRQFLFDEPVKVRLTNKGEIEYKQFKKLDDPIGQYVTIAGDNKGAILMAGANSTQSLDNALTNPHIQNTTNSNPAKPAKRSWLEITMWVVGIVSGLFVIWEFILKRFFNSP